MYCVDTNIIIELFRGDKDVEQKFNEIEETISITPLILCELYKGCYLSKQVQKDLESIKHFSEEVIILDFDKTSCRVFGELFSILKNKGIMVPVIDLMIAAMCIANDATLITHNKKHFTNIPGLKVEYM